MIAWTPAIVCTYPDAHWHMICFASVAPVSSSALCGFYCTDLWYMPSGAGVLTINLAANGLDSTVSSPAEAFIRLGLNMWTLGRPELEGTIKEFSFTVIGGTGVNAIPFTLRLLQRQLFGDNGWTAVVVASGMAYPVTLSHVSAASTGVIVLPVESARTMATITFTLPIGATLNLTTLDGVVLVSLGAAGTNTSLTFNVSAENGVTTAPFTITFDVHAPTVVPESIVGSSSSSSTGSDGSVTGRIASSSTGSVVSNTGMLASSTGSLSFTGITGSTSESSTDITPTAQSSTGGSLVPVGSSTGGISPTGSSVPRLTYTNATISMQLNYNRTTFPHTLIVNMKAGIASSIHFPSKIGQALYTLHEFVSRSSLTRRRLLQIGSIGEEVTHLTITFTPADPSDDGASKAALALSAQFKCLTEQCAADAASADGVQSVYTSPLLVAVMVAVDRSSITTIDGVSVPHSQTPTSDLSSNLSDGAIAGIVIGVVIGVALLVTVSWFALRAHRQSAVKVAHAPEPLDHTKAVVELAQLPATDA